MAFLGGRLSETLSKVLTPHISPKQHYPTPAHDVLLSFAYPTPPTLTGLVPSHYFQKPLPISEPALDSSHRLWDCGGLYQSELNLWGGRESPKDVLITFLKYPTPKLWAQGGRHLTWFSLFMCALGHSVSLNCCLGHGWWCSCTRDTSTNWQSPCPYGTDMLMGKTNNKHVNQ